MRRRRARSPHPYRREIVLESIAAVGLVGLGAMGLVVGSGWMPSVGLLVVGACSAAVALLHWYAGRR